MIKITMISSKLIKEIRQIPPDGEFLKESTEEEFIRHARFLKSLGVDDLIIISHLQILYYAIVQEYDQ